jgi:predicted Zn-dependent peptidase
MNTRTVLAAAVGLLLTTSSLGYAQNLPPLKHEKYTLPNGLTVILHEDHRAAGHGQHGTW